MFLSCHHLWLPAFRSCIPLLGLAALPESSQTSPAAHPPPAPGPAGKTTEQGAEPPNVRGPQSQRPGIPSHLQAGALPSSGDTSKPGNVPSLRTWPLRRSGHWVKTPSTALPPPLSPLSLPPCLRAGVALPCPRVAPHPLPRTLAFQPFPFSPAFSTFSLDGHFPTSSSSSCLKSLLPFYEPVVCSGCCHCSDTPVSPKTLFSGTRDLRVDSSFTPASWHASSRVSGSPSSSFSSSGFPDPS